LAQGADGTWFEEPILEGVALNRCPPGVDAQPWAVEAFDVLGRWLDRTRVERPVMDYAERLRASIRGTLDQVGLIDAPARDHTVRWLDSALALVGRLSERAPGSISLAVGHGDFQPGNILAGGNQGIWLLDWEHSAERQYLYDILVFGLRSRFSQGLSDRLAGLLSGSGAGLLHPNLWLPRLPGERGHLRLVLVVFLLEELAWYLEENANPVFLRPSGGWLQFSGEMDGALAALSRG
jgi:hypothetical protein